MARISHQYLKRSDKSSNRIHETVDATYSTFISQGKKYFQIDTYGSRDRQHVGKISQSFQIDGDTAKHLIELLKKEFNL